MYDCGYYAYICSSVVPPRPSMGACVVLKVLGSYCSGLAKTSDGRDGRLVAEVG